MATWQVFEAFIHVACSYSMKNKILPCMTNRFIPVKIKTKYDLTHNGNHTKTKYIQFC